MEDIFTLSVEQEFHVKLMEESIKQMSEEQKDEMLLQMARLLLVKDNTIKSMMKEALPRLEFK